MCSNRNDHISEKFTNKYDHISENRLKRPYIRRPYNRKRLYFSMKADFMQTKSYCEAILKQKRHNDVEGDGGNRCEIALFSRTTLRLGGMYI